MAVTTNTFVRVEWHPDLNMTVEQLRGLFRRFGRLARIITMTKKDTSKMFAVYLYYMHAADAISAAATWADQADTGIWVTLKDPPFHVLPELVDNDPSLKKILTTGSTT